MSASVDRVRRVWYRHRVICVRVARQVRAPGKAVRIRRDPVTVTGDETRECHWPEGREGAGSRTIRKPGDLPGRVTIDRSSREDPGEMVSPVAPSRIAILAAPVWPAATFRTRTRR